MKRPDFITEDQIERWSENIDKDENLPSFFKDAILLRELCYAGLWLAEELQTLNCPTHQIVQLQFTHGFQSFGNDCWGKAEELLNAYKNGEIEFEDEEELDERSLSGEERSN